MSMIRPPNQIWQSLPYPDEPLDFRDPRTAGMLLALTDQYRTSVFNRMLLTNLNLDSSLFSQQLTPRQRLSDWNGDSLTRLGTYPVEDGRQMPRTRAQSMVPRVALRLDLNQMSSLSTQNHVLSRPSLIDDSPRAVAIRNPSPVPQLMLETGPARPLTREASPSTPTRRPVSLFAPAVTSLLRSQEEVFDQLFSAPSSVSTHSSEGLNVPPGREVVIQRVPIPTPQTGTIPAQEPRQRRRSAERPRPPSAERQRSVEAQEAGNRPARRPETAFTRRAALFIRAARPRTMIATLGQPFE